MISIRTWGHTLAATLLACSAATIHAQSGTLSGRVTTAGGQPLAEARVQVVNTSVVTATNSEGRYTFRSAPAGAVEVRVVRVGYVEQKRPVTVPAGGTATLDFVMEQAVVKLQEIVTTATGETRRVEIGNAISTLGNVTQNVETTPIVNLGDLMVAKASGVAVLPGVMTGAAPVIHIRGTNSLSLNNNPIYVIDGVRMAANTIGLSTGGTQASLLNDIDPNEIEDVEIVKGPSAATLYGTDAANGVIVITTKKGHAGNTRWTYFGEGGAVNDRNKYYATYASWGHDSKTGALARCTLVTESAPTSTGSVCALDSVTSFNALRDPLTTPLRVGHRDQYGMNASGGTDQVRFFVSGDLQNELGPVHMPSFAQGTLDSLGNGQRDEWTNPEQFQNQTFRVNLNAAFSPRFDFSANAGFSNTNQRLPQVDNNTFSYIYSALNSPGFNHSQTTGTGLTYNELGTLGEYRNGYGGFSPAQIFQVLNQNATQRFIGSTDAMWRPLDWMQNQASAGVDLANSTRTGVCRFGECPNSGTTRQGSASSAQSNIRNFSTKFVSNSSWQARSNLSMKTTVGADYTNQENDGVADGSTLLPPGAQNVSQGAVPTVGNVTSFQTVNKTLGIYTQEQASFRDRMFLIVAARTDQNSSFGTKFQRVLYPKASLSWLLSDESFFPHVGWLNSFRLRSGFGASGVQPNGTQALQTFNATTVAIATVTGGANSADTPALLAAALGNTDLKPERSQEWENGFETSLLNNRLHLDVTYYDKRTHDAIINKPIAASSGASSLTVVQNLASVQNNGIEANVNATLLDRRSIGWDVSLVASHNSNKILGLGRDASGNLLPTIGTGTTRDSLGLPANAFFARPFTFADSNKDGIITPNEVVVGQNFVYAGYSSPRDIAAITNGFDLFNRKVRITVLTDYKGGYKLYNQSGQFYSQQTKAYPDLNLTSTSQFLQARSVANSNAKNPATVYGYLDNAATWKLREVSAAWTLPNTVAQRARAKDLQIVFAARNLKTWTKYTGVDPESNFAVGDVQQDFSTTAPRTYFVVRANLHY